MSHFILMGLGAVLSIASVFTFSLGWQMWRDSLDQAYVSGMLEIQIPGWLLRDLPDVRIAEPNGIVRARSMAEQSGRFRIGPVAPGGYVLQIHSKLVNCSSRSITLNKGSNYDLGTILCSVNERANWTRRFEHSQLLSATYTENATWLTGFRTSKESRNSYVLFRASEARGKFEEVVVPIAAGAERGSFITAFKTGELLFGTYGKGALISNDGGAQWEPLRLPDWVKSVRIALERRPGNWLIVAAGIPDNAEVPRGVPTDTLFETSDFGQSWTEIGQLPATTTSLVEHSSGRLLAGSESVYGTGGIMISEDGGATWLKAKLPFLNATRCIGVMKELRAGMLVAGTLRGIGWKNTYLDGGIFEQNGAIICSTDGGITWKYLGNQSQWGNIQGVAELPGNVLVASAGDSLIWSTDDGQSWASFGKPFPSWIRDIGIFKDTIYILSTGELLESSLDKTITRYAKRVN